MLGQVIFLLIYAFCLIVPGWALLALLNVSSRQWLHYPIASLGFFIGLLSGFYVLKIPIDWFAYAYFSIVSLMLVGATIRHAKHALFDCPVQLGELIATNWLVYVVGLFLAGYALFTGPYLEVPGDPLWHAARIRDAIEHWQVGSVLDFHSLQALLLAPNYLWYHFCGWVMSLPGVEFETGLRYIWLVNFLIFTTGFLSFAHRVLDGSHFERQQKKLAAVVALGFMLLHFGIGPFSYVRYYAYAPAIVALIGYWSVILVLVDFLNRRIGWIYGISLGLFYSVITFLLHRQEALFIGVMAILIIVGLFFRIVWAHKTQNGPGRVHLADLLRRLWSQPIFRRVGLCMILVALGYGFVHVYLYVNVVRNDALHGGWLRPVSQALPVLRHLFVLRPEGQFIQVLTVWGVFAYLVWFLHIRRIRFPIVVAAGMWVPIATVFSPVFIDFFLRLNYPEVVWRLSYLIPLELAMGVLVVWWIDQLRRSSTHYLTRIKYSVFIILSIILLAPFNLGFMKNEYHKLEMLKPVSPEGDHRYLSDLIELLADYPSQMILTDQITGYVLNGFTKHTYPGHKFYGHGALNTNKAEYEAESFSDFVGGLLVINRRVGSYSEIGAISGHWSADIRNYGNWYSDEFITFIKDNPKRFRLLSEVNQISVYQVVQP